ncbi:MAG: phosphate ABC transporter permease subunit PstC [Spirochaetaceae bacterium]
MEHSDTSLPQAARPISNAIREPAALYRRAGDRVFTAVIVAIGSTILVLAVLMAVILYRDSALTFTEIGFFRFLGGVEWNPVTGRHGAFPFLVGTVATSLAALIIAVPIGIGSAIFSAEYAPKPIATVVNYLVDLLASIPSVVLGLWGIFVFAPFMRRSLYMPMYEWAGAHAPWMQSVLGSPTTFNLATATLLLAFMIIPYTMALTRDAIGLVPTDQREAAWGLGATRFEVLKVAVLPAARGGIVAGALLSLARALGETMVLAMLVGNNNDLPFRPFRPAATMPSIIVNEFREAVETLHFTSVMAVGFMLFLLSLLINFAAAYIQRKLIKGVSRL